MAEKKQLKTKYQKQAEENETRYRELVDRARKIERANTATIERGLRSDLADLQAAQQAAAEEEEAQRQPSYNEPIGAPEPVRTAQQSSQPTTGGRLATKATDIVKDRAQKQVGTAVAQAAKKQLAQTAAKRLLEVIPGIGEVVLAADIANTVRKHWKTVASIIGSCAVIGIILLVIVLTAVTASPAAAGTGQVTSVNITAPTEISALQKVLAGGVVTKELAQEVLSALPALRTKYPEARTQVLLNDIEAAAQAIIDNANGANDSTVNAKQSAILKDKIGDFQTAITSDGCAGAICLAVPAIGQGDNSLCGVTSVTMVILYYNPAYSNKKYYDPAQNYKRKTTIKRPGVKVTNPDADYGCVAPISISNNAPADKKDWTRMTYQNTSRQAVIDTMRRSIEGQDPVVLYTIPGGTIHSGKHIVAVVGYDAKDEPGKGGTFIIHNPKPGDVSPYTRYMDYKSGGTKLTAQHLMQYLGGDGSYNYNTSIMVRKTYITK